MSKKPSALGYALIAIAVAAAAVVLVLLFAWVGQTKLPRGMQDREYYLLLTIWGCVCAIVLFGVVRSVAQLTHTTMSTSVELGGPAAVAALVVWGGLRVIDAPNERSITVRPFAVDSTAPLITKGTATLELGNIRPAPESLSARGEARFEGLAVGRVLDSVRILVTAPGYVERWLALPVRNDVVDVPMVRLPPTITVRGRLIPRPVPKTRTVIELDGNRGQATVDSTGAFALTATAKRGESVGVRVLVDGRVVLDQFVLLDTLLSLTVQQTGGPSRPR